MASYSFYGFLFPRNKFKFLNLAFQSFPKGATNLHMKSYYLPLFSNYTCLHDHLTHLCNLVLFPVFSHINPIAIQYPAYWLPTMGKSTQIFLHHRVFLKYCSHYGILLL